MVAYTKPQQAYRSFPVILGFCEVLIGAFYEQESFSLFFKLEFIDLKRTWLVRVEHSK